MIAVHLLSAKCAGKSEMLFNVTPLLDGRNQAGIIIAVFLGYYIKSRFFKSKKRTLGKWKSPFDQDSRKEITPLVTEQTVRDEVLKKGMIRRISILSYSFIVNLKYFAVFQHSLRT